MQPQSTDREKSQDTSTKMKPTTQEKDVSPGSPSWWLDYLTRKVMDRQPRFDVLEDYAVGNHPLPNGKKQYQRALREIQKKSRTNYCELVIKATTERMRVKGFRFGAEGEADEQCREIWDANKMDIQSIIAINNAATLGFAYGLVQGPDDQSEEPYISIEDPRQCIVEYDPIRYGRRIAGMKVWQDRVLQCLMAVLYLPDQIYVYKGKSINNLSETDLAKLTSQIAANPAAASFQLISVQDNKLGDVPLVEGMWQPEHSPLSRAEHEGVLDIQDRINHTVLSRLIISDNQAYRQRWVSGVSLKKGKNNQSQKPPWDPGADVLWVTDNDKARFGDFEQADIMQVLQAVKDDVGDMAAISQTPATYLMNRMVNVSGDTLTQDQSALVSKIRGHRHVSMGFFFEELMGLAFKYIGGPDPAPTPEEDPNANPALQKSQDKSKPQGPEKSSGKPNSSDDHEKDFEKARTATSKIFEDSKQEFDSKFGDKSNPKAKEPRKSKANNGRGKLMTLWHDPELRSIAEQADAYGKLTTAGIPPAIAAERVLDATPEEMTVIVQEAEKMKAQEQLMAQQTAEQANQNTGMQGQLAHKNAKDMAEVQNQHAIQQIKAKPAPKAAGK